MAVVDENHNQARFAPSLLAPIRQHSQSVSVSDAAQAASDALLAVDAIRIGRQFHLGQPIGPMALFSAYWVLADITGKVPPNLYYYSHGFRRELPTIYVAPGLVFLFLPKIMLGNATTSLLQLSDKYVSFAESALSVLRSDSWWRLGVKALETLLRGREAIEAAEKAGELTSTALGANKPAVMEIQPSWRDIPESRDPAWNQGEAYRGDDPRGVSQPIEMPGMDDGQTFNA